MTSEENLGRPRRWTRSVKGDPRPRTISPKALGRWQREEAQEEDSRVKHTHQRTASEQAAPLWCRRETREDEECVSFTRPATRGECRHLPRPCPFVGCRHHLYLDAKPTGAITLSWPHLAPWEIPESCALDVAECGEHTLDEVGALLNVTQERIRKIEVRALGRLRTEHGRRLAAHLPGCRGAVPPLQQPVPAIPERPQPVPEPLGLSRAEVGL